MDWRIWNLLSPTNVLNVVKYQCDFPKDIYVHSSQMFSSMK